MRQRYDSIYLSPHLDDAALSCGGQIYEQSRSGKSVLVVTLFAGDPPPGLTSTLVSDLHRRWGLGKDAAAIRRDEDRKAAEVLGFEPVHFEFADCIYRHEPMTLASLYPTVKSIFGEIKLAEADLVAELAGRLAGLAGADRIHAPLAVGHHVDHQLVRLAAERQFGSRLSYYEDYPYVARFFKLTRALARPWSWRCDTVALSDEALRARVEAIACYASQLGPVYADRDDLEKQVRAYARKVGGERLWVRR